jgi:uncharacterized protein YceH (UPF0502 family)
MDIVLTDVEIRVLGSLMEKQMATPEYYPLSLNALTSACNQKSNREPVVDFDEATVAAAVESLAQKGLASRTDVGRVAKFEETFSRGRNFIAREAALMCLLLLRGPQTPGELRGRSGRLCACDNLAQVLETLANLQEWGLVRPLARRPGQKEIRYMHLLGGAHATEAAAPPSEAPADEPMRLDQTSRLTELEASVAALEAEVRQLREGFEAFRRQFE